LTAHIFTSLLEHCVDVLTAQNNELMRQVQQQLAGHQGGAPPPQGGGGLGQLQNIDANVLMSAFQQAAPPGQNPLQGAESLIASVLAAANNSSQNQNGAPNGQQPALQPAPGGSQQNPFAGFEQLQGLAPAALQQGFPQSFNGLQGLQQHLINLQHHLGGGVGQGQEQPQQNLPDQQDQQAAVFAQQQAQQQFPWIGQMGQQYNPAAFNPASLSLGALTGGANHAAFQGQDPYSQLAGQNTGIPLGLNPAAFQFQEQSTGPPKETRRGSLLSGGSGQAKNLSTLLSEEHESSTKKSGKAKKKEALDKKKRAKSFPEKLMQVMIEHGKESAVAWLPDGKSFVVVDPDIFCSEVLNKIFKRSKYASFVRKIHRYVNEKRNAALGIPVCVLTVSVVFPCSSWGFVRLTSGTGTDCFHHPQFQRNKRDLAGKITSTRGDKDALPIKTNVKPPSLAGVEKFIRAKVVAAAATAVATAEESLLLKEEDQLSGEEGEQ
jgi:hypothetical protein